MIHFDLSRYENPRDEVFDGEDFQEVTPEEICEQSRWHTFYEQIFQYKPDESFWKAEWSRGSTEYQDDGLEELTLTKVKPYQVTVTKYQNAEE